MKMISKKSPVSIFLRLCLLLLLLAVPVTAGAAQKETVTITGSKVVAKGKKITLKANCKVKWSSGNKKIATVSAKGVVKGLKPGKVTITAVSKANKSVKARWKIRVYKKPASSIKIKASSKTLDPVSAKTTVLKAAVTPASAARSVTWKSSNPSVASVDENGKVTALQPGTAKITATASDGSKKKKSVRITVKDNADAKQMKGLKVGISMPSKDLLRWFEDGNKMKQLLEKKGCKADLRFASNDVKTQQNQVSELIESGCEVLVIAAVDGSRLSNVLKAAKQKNIPVIAYDRLLTKTNAVSSYLSFDSDQVGKLQGTFIADALNLDKASGPFRLEITAGDSRDSNALAFYNGAMDVLKPYIKSGKLIVSSGEESFSKAATIGWMDTFAKNRAKKIISKYYAKGTDIDAWLCSNDSTASGVIAALKASYKGKWPVITGQDCDLENVKNILAGKQSMSVYKRTYDLVRLTVSVVGSYAAGKKAADDTKIDNGTIQVPAVYAAPIAITKKNYTLLISDGFYTKSMLK